MAAAIPGTSAAAPAIHPSTVRGGLPRTRSTKITAPANVVTMRGVQGMSIAIAIGEPGSDAPGRSISPAKRASWTMARR